MNILNVRIKENYDVGQASRNLASSCKPELFIQWSWNFANFYFLSILHIESDIIAYNLLRQR